MTPSELAVREAMKCALLDFRKGDVFVPVWSAVGTKMVVNPTLLDALCTALQPFLRRGTRQELEAIVYGRSTPHHRAPGNLHDAGNCADCREDEQLIEHLLAWQQGEPEKPATPEWCPDIIWVLDRWRYYSGGESSVPSTWQVCPVCKAPRPAGGSDAPTPS